MKLGVCYYPEHWPEERWPIDARQMREAGISIVRIAEFAWALMEPSQGTYSWDWLDQAIETMAVEGHDLVLCTPTAAPPAWLIQAHPEILPVDEEGRRRRFGSRRHYCPNNATYRAHSNRIATALAERYGEHPSVIGWQIDNEFGCYFARCYCPICVDAFREWLKAKYQTLEALNQAWGTVFWSQVYDRWEQIKPPNLTVAEPNPSHVLDYYRFYSDSWVEYQQVQIDALRETISADQFITHNIIGSLTTLDYHDLARELDFIAWDSYPTGYAETESENLYSPGETPPAFAHDLGDPFITGFFHALTRGLKQAPFWVMEQQTGAINWSVYNAGVNPGAVRLWTWQALASGAEAVIYFRWRASRFGLEQHHAGLRRHDGSADVGYGDLLAMQDQRDLLQFIADEPFEAKVAILLDYDDLWALELQPHRRGFGYLKLLFVYYRACKHLGLNVDIVSPEADLSGYNMLIAPSAHLGSTQLADRLTDYASRGGTLMLGIRSGFKTSTNVVTDRPLPGDLKNLAGVTISAWHALPPEVGYPFESTIPELQGQAGCWAESLSPLEGTEMLAQYTSGPFQSLAALTRHSLEAGDVYYLGIYPSVEQAQALLAHLAADAGLATLPSLSKSLLVQRRGEQMLVFNFSEQLQTASDLEIKPRHVEIIPNLSPKTGEDL